MPQPADESSWELLRKLQPSPSATNTVEADRWDPWRAVVEHYPGWTVSTEYELPGDTLGMTFVHQKRIYLCCKATPTEQTCTLAHELVHVELGILNGHGAHRHEDYTPMERLVCEVTAKRLVPFRDLAKVVVQRPDALVRVWAWMLRVDLLTLRDRFMTLSPVERAALAEVRGGPLPTMPHHELYDGELVA